jgi:hypothetical protein
MTAPHLEAIRSATRHHAGATHFVHFELQSNIKIHQATADLWFGDCLDSFRCVCRQDLEQKLQLKEHGDILGVIASRYSIIFPE